MSNSHNAVTLRARKLTPDLGSVCKSCRTPVLTPGTLCDRCRQYQSIYAAVDDVDIDAVVPRLEAEIASGGNWRPALARLELTASEQLTVLRRLGDGVLSEAGRRGVQADWKEYQSARKKAAAEAAMEEVAGERHRLEYDPTRFNVVLGRE